MFQGVRDRLALAVGVLLVAVVAVVIAVHRSATAGPPFALADMHARVTKVEIVPDTVKSQSALDRLAGKSRLNIALLPGRPQVVVGQLDYDVAAPLGTDGQLVLFVIDTRERMPFRNVWGVGPSGSAVAQGWDGRYERLSSKYTWLSMLAEQHTDAGYTDPGMAIAMRPDVRGPITFEAVADGAATPITEPAKQLTFVLAYVGDSRGAWAERLPVS